jgi:hypothetical protein
MRQGSLFPEEVLRDVRCTRCGVHIRTIRKPGGVVMSEYRGGDGECWECRKKGGKKKRVTVHSLREE